MRKQLAAHVIVRAIVYIGFFAAFFYLFTQQASGAYPSDLPAHIKPPADDTYSALRVLYKALEDAFGVQGICAFLALVEVGAMAISEYLIIRLAPKANPWVAFVSAVACNFVIAIYLPFIHPYFVVGSPGASCWHNSTYSVMRLVALIAMAFYLKFDGVIPARSKALSWIAFTFFLTLATSVKPSFVIVFGPAVFALCVIDLVRGGKSTVKRSLLVGLSLLIALVVVFYQLTILFPSDGSGEGGIAFGLAKVWRARNANIFVNFFQALAFPLLATAVARPKFWKDRALLLAWLMTIVAMAEYVFLYETGSRTYHGNFGWGICYALCYLFIVAAAVFLKERGSRLKLLKEGEGTSSLWPERPDPDAILSPGTRKVLDYVTLLAFAWHTCSGVWYFIRVMLGHSYF